MKRVAWRKWKRFWASLTRAEQAEFKKLERRLLAAIFAKPKPRRKRKADRRKK